MHPAVIYFIIGFVSAFVAIMVISAVDDSFGEDVEDFMIVGLVAVVGWPVVVGLGAIYLLAVGAHNLGRYIGKRFL